MGIVPLGCDCIIGPGSEVKVVAGNDGKGPEGLGVVYGATG